MPRLRDFQGIEGQDFFEMDPGFQSLLKDLLPTAEQGPVFNSLHGCARLVAGRWNNLAREASTREHLPKIGKFDRVGGPVEPVDFGSLTRHLRLHLLTVAVGDQRAQRHRYVGAKTLLSVGDFDGDALDLVDFELAVTSTASEQRDER